ncbi:MAG: TerC/Alx family metal homeostasis membrane protein [Planctomycetes bacterium]|nr:TerC/Alx family metal homeostasis membrane protein [Planctomycetota bacterium]
MILANHEHVFPIANYSGFMSLFFLGIAALLTLDLGILHRSTKVIHWKSALKSVIGWTVLALLFNVFFWWLCKGWLAADPSVLAGSEYAAKDGSYSAAGAANQIGLQWLASYIIELSLSVDNLFVFVIIFRHFTVPAGLQYRVLFWGILGAVALRILFITAGIELIHRFEWLASILGAFLMLTGVKLIVKSSQEDHTDPSKSVGYKLLRRMMPLTNEFHGSLFFIRRNRRWVATPLFAALVVIDITDIIFAVDSVPAVLAITKEPIIAITSNIAAILGLRAMYFLLANAVDRFHLLKPALGLVLAFVGLKMVWSWWFATSLLAIHWSLAIVLGIIVLGAVGSLAFPPKIKDAAPPL